MPVIFKEIMKAPELLNLTGFELPEIFRLIDQHTAHPDDDFDLKKEILAIEKQLNPATGAVVKENPDFIKNGDAAIVRVKPVQPLAIETQKEIPQMARFAVRDSGSTVAAGMCIALVKKQ